MNKFEHFLSRRDFLRQSTAVSAALMGASTAGLGGPLVEGREITAARGVVGADPQEGARVGARVLAMGGNAMDAAAATSVACCMLQPASTGIGGYVCAAVVLDRKSHRVWSLDSKSVEAAAGPAHI